MAPYLRRGAVFEATPVFWSVVEDMPGVREALAPDGALREAVRGHDTGALRSGPHPAAGAVAAFPRRRSSPMAADEAPETTDAAEAEQDTTAHAGNETGDGEADAE